MRAAIDLNYKLWLWGHLNGLPTHPLVYERMSSYPVQDVFVGGGDTLFAIKKDNNKSTPRK